MVTQVTNDPLCLAITIIGCILIIGLEFWLIKE